MMEWAQNFTVWAQTHSTLALSVVFLAAFLDCLFLVGLIFISAPFLLGAGVLVAAGAFEFWPVLLAIASGGTVGNTCSYLIGRHYGQALFNRPYLAKRPALLNHGRAFFARHGGKGLILAHHIGVLRPMLAAVAGAYGLQPSRFALAVVPATLLWALACTVIGMVIGASMGLAAEVTRRLAILIVGTGVTLWLILWLGWAVARTLQGHAESWLGAMLRVGRLHRILGKLGPALADPEQPETPTLSLIAVALWALAVAGLLLIWGISPGAAPPDADLVVHQTLRSLDNPWATSLAVSVSLLGEWPVYLPFAFAVLLLLAAQRYRRAAAHWLAALLFGGAITLGLNLIPSISNPLELSGLVASAHFPRDLMLATVLYGFTPVLLLGSGRRVPGLVSALVLSLLVVLVLSRLYLGTLWLSVGLVTALLSLAWIGALSLGYRLHRPDRVAPLRIAPAFVILLLAAVWHHQQDYPQRLREHTPVTVNRPLEAARWWTHDWTLLRARRQDMAGHDKQYLNLQWAGTLDDIRATLEQAGWSETPRVDFVDALGWLSDDTPIAELPLLPRYHAGQPESLRLRLGVDSERQYTLRLWASGYTLDERLPLWTGTLVVQQAQTTFRVLRYPSDQNIYSAALDALPQPLPGWESQRRRREHTTYETLLLRPQAP